MAEKKTLQLKKEDSLFLKVFKDSDYVMVAERLTQPVGILFTTEQFSRETGVPESKIEQILNEFCEVGITCKGWQRHYALAVSQTLRALDLLENAIADDLTKGKSESERTNYFRDSLFRLAKFYQGILLDRQKRIKSSEEELDSGLKEHVVYEMLPEVKEALKRKAERKLGVYDERHV